MRLDLLTVIAATALCLSGCSTAGGSPNRYLVEKLPPPRSADGEPPIQTRKGQYSGQNFYSQEFTDERVHRVSTRELSVAKLYSFFGERKEDLPPQVVTARCNIGSSGEVLLTDCVSKDGSTEDQRLALLLMDADTKIDVPDYRTLPEGFADLTRTVRLNLAIPEVKSPSVDLATGPFVEAQQLILASGGSGVGSSNYPSRALRREAEGDMELECQVQIDLSVICRSISFEPAEHFDLFARAGERLFDGVSVEAETKDGSDARGVRFRRKVLWRIPGYSPAEQEGANPPGSPQPE